MAPERALELAMTLSLRLTSLSCPVLLRDWVVTRAMRKLRRWHSLHSMVRARYRQCGSREASSARGQMTMRPAMGCAQVELIHRLTHREEKANLMEWGREL